MANPVSSVDVPLSLFSGWNTELSPPDQPEGASPANNDVAFTPGAVSTRPGLNRIFGTPLSSLGPFSYEKSYVMPSGQIKNLYLTMGDGKLWVEDVTNAPGTATLLFQSAGATYASSVTAAGREYIMLSDGQHGADIPLQYDGTNLWRVTQDGPGAPPLVASVALPESTLASSAATPEAIATAQGTVPVVVGGVTAYQRLVIVLSGSPAVFNIGQVVTVASNSVSTYNINGNVLSIVGQVLTLQPLGNPASGAIGTGGTLSGPVATLSRSNNTVTASTSTPHSFLQGYQVQISKVAPTVVGAAIVSIVIDNEESPGIATITMATSHGLLPNNIINIGPVPPTVVGGNITFVQRSAQIATITMSSAPNVFQGSVVTVEVSSIGNVTFDGQWEVLSILGNSFSFAQVDVDFPQTADSGTGTVSLNWPLANVDPSLNYFTVQTSPSPTTFTVSFSYTNGTWGSGTLVTFGWTGTFFVTAVLSPTSFQYQQYGPSVSTTASGTATPYGQATPGIHQVQQAFLLFSGAITQPSPPSTFVANGGQYLSVSNLAIGPTSSVAGRVLIFTGAGGAFFFYIPVPAQVNGLVVSTATQINDNTTTGLILDFSDNTLYAATATSIPGNDLAAQVVLGTPAGTFSYASRLMVWGEYNKVQNLLNMGFDGGYITTDMPTGWTVATSGGSIIPARVATAWQIAVTAVSTQFGKLTQNAAFDANGAPIILPNTNYYLRLLISSTNPAADVVLEASLTSATTGFSSVVQVSPTSTTGAFQEVDFPLITPASIPADLQFSVYGFTSDSTATGTLLIDEVELIYTDQPYLDTQSRISYAENFEGFNIQTGVIGAQDDQSPIRNFGVIRQSLYIITGTGLHETQDNDQTEPSGWNVDQIADNCGAFSIAAVARNAQGIGSAGKDWMMWSGPDGAQIFTGQKPWKISQEIQSVWDAIPTANAYQCWVKNYENSKRCFFGVPYIFEVFNVPIQTMRVLVLDYRNIDGAAIAENPPIHISFSGKMIVSDLTRKWTSWTIPAWCGELMYRNTIAQPQIVLGCLVPNGGPAGTGAPNAYILNDAQFHDDDFGIIPASYTTYFFVSHEMEQALQVGSHRKIYTMAAAFISGVGTWNLIPLAAALSNAFPSSPSFPLSLDPLFDMDFGINVTTTRCAFTIKAAPIGENLDSYFKLQKLVINMAKDPNAPARGSSGGTF